MKKKVRYAQFERDQS